MLNRPTAPQDWRILRLLSAYRLALVALLLGLLMLGYTPQIMLAIKPGWYQATCYAYALFALLLAGGVQTGWPRLGAQAHLNFFTDVVAIAVLVYASGGLDAGLGTLLLIPAVACALVVSPRMALAQAAIGTLVIFGEELLRQIGGPVDFGGFTSAGVLGLILFGTSVAATTVAQRARRSEALAERMGSEFDNLTRLNELILESMETGVLVLDQHLRIGNLNAAARELLRATGRAEGRLLELESPPLAEQLRQWVQYGAMDSAPVLLGPGMAEVTVRASRLGTMGENAVLVLIEDASHLHEKAQQIKLAALGRLSASIAHEIRNPLAAISHAGQLLNEAPDIDAADRRLLNMILRHTERIDRIVDDVLALSRREVPQPLAIPVGPWLEDTVALYREGRHDGACRIEIGEVPRGVSVQFDPRHLQQVLFNLWDNAQAHGQRTGIQTVVRLSVGVERSGRPWLDVSDNGPGVPEELIERIFEPFFTTSHAGTGLGLYLVRELCEFNQARIAYQRQPQPGACFRISFRPGLRL